ncbi:hypothetical protein HZA45_02855 [Candidatus Peregrinibacteria bacterium]|nr:hypothetical protein [Candidatus Peregrinibacteria bacterium]
MQRLREFSTLALLSLLPFHALLVTTGTKLMLGPGHAPTAMLAGWKEVILGMILLSAFLEIVHSSLITHHSSLFKWDWIDALILALLVLSITLLLTGRPSSLSHYILGFKYDFIPLVAFLVLRRVPWSDDFKNRVPLLLLIVGCIVALYGILTFFLPMSFFVNLGYSDAHSIYLANGPLAAFQQIGGSAVRRIQSTFSGPNQFGLWLLIPWAIAMIAVVRTRCTNYRYLISALLIAAALLLTFSRAAWIGAFIIFIATPGQLPPKTFMKIIVPLIAACGVGFVMLLQSNSDIFLRLGSDRGHFERPLQAIQMMRDFPLGKGLGTAGPATNRTHDACVFLETGDDPSWAKSNPDLCVFTGKTQVQPAGKTCNCPVLPENWYLQIGVELGIAGFLLYLIFIGFVARWLVSRFSFSPLHKFLTLTFLGLSVAALFLHAWEDAAVAYSVWILMAIVMQQSLANVRVDA